MARRIHRQQGSAAARRYSGLRCHGLADPLIDPSISAALVERYCAAGASVTALWMPGVEHILSSNNAAPAFMDWLAGLLSGGSATNNCGDALPVSPAPELK